MKLSRVYEPDEDLVHFDSVGNQDAVTLCGQTDWLHSKARGVPSSMKVTFLACIGIVKEIQASKKEIF